jgi:hypothetical protein
MKKYLLFAVVTIVLAVGSASAQSVGMIANIPFDFVVGNTTFHGGTYTFRPVGEGADIVLLRRIDIKDAVLLPTFKRTSEPSPSPQSQLVFKVVETHYYLWQIWTRGYNVGREVAAKIPETELAATSKRRPVVIPMANLP